MATRQLTRDSALTQERVKQVLAYDPLSGIFRWLICEVVNQIHPGDVAGCRSDKGYWHIRVDGELHYRSRLAWFYMTGEWPTKFVDHRDRERQNDRWKNLRLATNQDNIRNSKLRIDNSSGVKGVYWMKRHRSWQASIRVDKKLLHLGNYKDLGDAALARRAAELKYFGEFAPNT